MSAYDKGGVIREKQIKELNDFISDAKSTKGVSMRGASSWSTNRDVADNAMMYFDYDSVDKFGNPKNCRVILRCKKQKYATSIDYLSVNYGQDEVVASSRARYKLVQVRNSGDNYFIDIEAK